MRKVFEFLGHANNFLTVLSWLGIATFGGLVSGAAALWAYFSPMSGLAATLIFLFVFTSVLWSCIGLIWLGDRTANRHPIKSRKLLDCSWGLMIDGAFLNRDLSPTAAFEWQITVQCRNTCSWPLRIDVLNQETIIENIVADKKLEFSLPAIAMPN
jgi:hypothetical protein